MSLFSMSADIIGYHIINEYADRRVSLVKWNYWSRN